MKRLIRKAEEVKECIEFCEIEDNDEFENIKYELKQKLKGLGEIINIIGNHFLEDDDEEVVSIEIKYKDHESYDKFMAKFNNTKAYQKYYNAYFI